MVHLTRETALLDGRQSEYVLCCFPRHLLIFAETSKFQWTVKWSWIAKEVLLYVYWILV